MALNLHAVVNNAIGRIHPHIQATLYQSLGQENRKGVIIPKYAKGIAIEAQMQSESASTLFHTNRIGQEEETRKLYLYSDASMQTKVAGIVRPLSRNGDIIYIPDTNGSFDNTWWLVIAVIEDFTRSGWASVRATLQVKAPQGIDVEDANDIEKGGTY